MYQKRNGDIDIKCLGQGKCYHIDHIIPKSKNGTNKENNLVASCPRCNAIKGTRNLVEFLNKCIQTKRDLEEKLENTYKRIDKIKELRGKINYE